MSPARGRGERVEKAQGKAGEGRWPAGLRRRVGRASGLVQVHIWAGRWCPSLLSASHLPRPLQGPHGPGLPSPPASSKAVGAQEPSSPQDRWRVLWPTGTTTGGPAGVTNRTTQQQKQAGEGWGGRAPCTLATPHRKQPWDTVVGDQAPAEEARGAHVTTRLCHLCRKWTPDREP